MSGSGCIGCGGSMEGKRSHAAYCSRACKTRASDARRVADGREKDRSSRRYAGEADRRRRYALEYYAAHKDKVWEWRLAKRSRRMGASVFEVTRRDWTRLLARYSYRCAYCGAGGDLVCDHVIPLSRGGAHSIGNIVPACARCNMQKRTQFVTEWRLAG